MSFGRLEVADYIILIQIDYVHTAEESARTGESGMKFKSWQCATIVNIIKI